MPSDKEPSAADKLVLSSYIKLVRAAESVISRSHRHLAEANLSFSQFAVLEALYHLGPLSQKDIATKILKSPRNITMVVDNLEKNNLVRRERDNGDRRITNVHLTEEGLSLFERIFPRHVANLKEEMGILDTKELKELGRLCRILGKRERD
jgi:MarR family 2-MHQ and catechol resistance regulon transcriptional repressor